MTDPRDDALAIVRTLRGLLERAKDGINNEVPHPSESIIFLREKITDAIDKADAHLSAPPSQSESDDEKLVEAMAMAIAPYIGQQRATAWQDRADAAGAAKDAIAVARKALTPPPTPYVRPAAEIRAEIERLEAERKDIRHTEGAKIENKARIAGLTFALTPPTQEPH